MIGLFFRLQVTRGVLLDKFGDGLGNIGLEKKLAMKPDQESSGQRKSRRAVGLDAQQTCRKAESSSASQKHTSETERMEN